MVPIYLYLLYAKTHIFCCLGFLWGVGVGDMGPRCRERGQSYFIVPRTIYHWSHPLLGLFVHFFLFPSPSHCPVPLLTQTIILMCLYGYPFILMCSYKILSFGCMYFKKQISYLVQVSFPCSFLLSIVVKDLLLQQEYLACCL